MTVGRPAALYTIGHSNLSMERFLDALKAFEIATVVDVRSTPFSRFNPQFNREALSASLEEAGIGYRFAGRLLGGRPEDPSCYRNGEVPQPGADFLELVDYEAVARRSWFRDGVDRLLDIAMAETTVIMCSEENPNECHRLHLITLAVLDREPVFHIRTKGSVRLEAQSEISAIRQLSLM